MVYKDWGSLERVVVDKVRVGMVQALDYVKNKNNNMININDYNKGVMQKVA